MCLRKQMKNIIIKQKIFDILGGRNLDGIKSSSDSIKDQRTKRHEKIKYRVQKDKNMNRDSVTLENIKLPNISIIKVLEGRGRKKTRKIMAEHFPNLMKTINLLY